MNKDIYINDLNIKFDIKKGETLNIYHYVFNKSVNVIINLNGELSCEEYFHELEKLELLDANKTQDYTNFIHNRSRKLK